MDQVSFNRVVASVKTCLNAFVLDIVNSTHQMYLSDGSLNNCSSIEVICGVTM